MGRVRPLEGGRPRLRPTPRRAAAPPHRPSPMLSSLARTAVRRAGASASARAPHARGMAGGAPGGHDGVTFEGVTLHKPKTWHVAVGQGLAGVMW